MSRGMKIGLSVGVLVLAAGGVAAYQITRRNTTAPRCGWRRWAGVTS